MVKTPSSSPPHHHKVPTVPDVQIVDDMNAIGLQVRAQRLKQGLRIDDAAALIGVSVDLLSRLENGHGGVRTDKLLVVLSSLGLGMVLLPKDHPKMQALALDHSVQRAEPV